MLEHFQHISVIPFMLTLNNGNAGKINVQRIIEALIIAGVTAGVTIYGTQQVIETKIGYIEKQVEQNRSDIKNLDSGLVGHIREELERIASENRK